MLWKPMISSPGPRLRRATSATSCSKLYWREWYSLVKENSVVPSFSPGLALLDTMAAPQCARSVCCVRVTQVRFGM